MGPGIVRQIFDVYRKIRNTLRFLLGSISDFDPASHRVPYQQLPAVDKFMLARWVG